MTTLAHKIAPIYNVGIYARLSREDGDSVVSESITNQIDYLTRYTKEQPGWNLVDIFIDDGYTGTNFNRPDFKRLIKSVEDDRINLIITKDLSRLGRDYIDTGHYVERYFPQNNVRYIALNDGVDTFERNNSNNDMSPFKSVMNDFYARDISKKVRSAMNTKKKSGQYIGAFAPYGYLKSPEDRNKLIIDPQASQVVHRIFTMYLAGSGLTHIAHVLNDEVIPCPSVYKASQHTKYKNAKAIMGLWTTATVKYILTNPTYQGDLTQSKYNIISYKVKKLKATPKESWLTVPDTHEPIVDKVTFYTAQNLLQNRAPQFNASSKKSHLLGGLLYCKDCGSRMTFTKTQKGTWFCICSNYKQFKQCTRHSYIEEDLEKYIMEDLRRIVESSLDEVRVSEKATVLAGSRIKTTEDRRVSEVTSIEKRLADIQRTLRGMYEDKAKGVLTERDYMDFSKSYNTERDNLSAKLEKLKASQDTPQDSQNSFLNIVLDLIKFNNPSRLIISRIINKIEIDEKKNIEIYYNFKKNS